MIWEIIQFLHLYLVPCRHNDVFITFRNVAIRRHSDVRWRCYNVYDVPLRDVTMTSFLQRRPTFPSQYMETSEDVMYHQRRCNDFVTTSLCLLGNDFMLQKEIMLENHCKNFDFASFSLLDLRFSAYLFISNTNK